MRSHRAGSLLIRVVDPSESPASAITDDATRTAAIGAAPPELTSLPGGTLMAQVFRLALPMLGEQFFYFLIGLIDSYLAGTISKEATAAVGTASYMGWMVGMIFALVGTGAAAVVARSFGGRDLAVAQRALNQAILLALAAGLVASIGTWLASGQVARALTQTPTARELCQQFLQIDAGGYLFLCITTAGGAVLRASGDMLTPMRIMLGVNIVNSLLAAGLVYGWFGPPTGVQGIAYATLAARCLGALAMLVLLAGGLRGMHLRRADFRPDPVMIGRILRIGGPAALDAIVMSAAQFAFIQIVSRSGAADAGTANYAAHMIAMRLEAISYLPAFAWGTAAATLVGQYLGAGQPQTAYHAGQRAALQSVLITSSVGIGFFFLADVLFQLMTHDPAVRAVGAPAFRLIAFAQPFIGAAIVYFNALRGAGDTRWPMYISLICGVGLRVPLAYVGAITLGGGLIGAWCGMWADNIVRAILSSLRFAYGRWRETRV